MLGVLPMFHLTGMQSNMNIPINLGGTTVLMTRWDRDTAAELIQRHRVTGVTGITTMIVDFLANPDIGKYDLSSIVRIGGGGAVDAGGGGRENREDARPAVPRRLRPHRDHGAFARQPGAAAQAPVRRHPVLRHRFARDRPGVAPRVRAERSGRDHHPRPAGVPRLLEAGKGDRGRLHRLRRQDASSAPATSATTTRKAISSSPTA